MSAPPPLADEIVSDALRYPTLSSHTEFEGHVVSLRQDEVRMSDGATGIRDIVVHPGAVGVIALDDQDRVVMIRQYRHPVRSYLWEVPAGIKDVADEPLVETARRELAEEVGLAADRWDRLVDFLASPGGSSEEVTVFLARNLREVGRPEDFVVSAEELDLQIQRVPLDEALIAVQDGRMRNSIVVAGVLAAVVARSTGWQGLRPPA